MKRTEKLLQGKCSDNMFPQKLFQREDVRQLKVY